MTLTGNFLEEKAYVREEMQRMISELTDDRVLPTTLKELVIKIGVILVF